MDTRVVIINESHGATCTICKQTFWKNEKVLMYFKGEYVQMAHKECYENPDKYRRLF